MGSLAEGNATGDDGSLVGLPSPAGERGAQVHPPRTPLRPGGPGRQARHARHTRDAPRPRGKLRGAFEAGVRLCARRDVELWRKA